jgi:HEAT repeat protein
VIRLEKTFVRIAFALSVVVLGALPAAAQVGLPGSNPQRSTRQTNPGASDIDESTKNLRDEDPGVRLEAVKSLAASQDKKAVEHLIEATADLDPRVKIKAIDALGTLRAADATPVLVQVLYMRESEPWLQQLALVSL